jgi:hypothetical protein
MHDDATINEATKLFGFITDDDFKVSLGIDYCEMKSGLTNENHKSVMVLAGSIVEAVLLDYLLATKYKSMKPEDILKMDLKNAVDACRGKDNVLTDSTADATTVIRGFRNLIHPGRIKRLEEKIDGNRAQIAASLVQMVVEEVREKRLEVYGYTAQQIVEKVENDLDVSLVLMPRILPDLNKIEQEKLLLKVIPSRVQYFSTHRDLMPADEFPKIIKGLRTVFRMMFDKSQRELKKKTTEQFVKVLKEQSEFNRMFYNGLFYATDLQYIISKNDRELVIDYIINEFCKKVSDFNIEAAHGVTVYIHCSDNDIQRLRNIWHAVYLSNVTSGRFNTYSIWLAEEYKKYMNDSSRTFLVADMEQHMKEVPVGSDFYKRVEMMLGRIKNPDDIPF